MTTTRVVKTSPSGARSIETTTAEAHESVFDRVLGVGGLLALRTCLALLAAFLAAAVVQRAILANFEIEAGPVKIPKDARRAIEASRAVVTDLAAQVERNAKGTAKALRTAGELERRIRELEARWRV